MRLFFNQSHPLPHCAEIVVFFAACASNLLRATAKDTGYGNAKERR